ncbi:MAG: YciI family protein [Fimbriimonas sp.]
MPEYIYFVHPPRSTFPGDGTEEEFAIVREHFAYLQDKLARGELILAGRTQDMPPTGLAIFEAEDDVAARRFFENDPAVVKGVFKGEVRPYSVALLRGRD